jgi:hypothetical protein
MRTNAILAIVVMLASPMAVANTPRELVQGLTRAAHGGDFNAFLAEMSANTRRAMTDADVARSKLIKAQKGYAAALDERFGAGRLGGATRFGIADRKTILSQFVDIDLIAVEQNMPNKTLLRLKTIAKGSNGRITTEENTFPAIQENGKWKLDLTDLILVLIQTAAYRASAYEHVAQDIRAGIFKDRISAQIALVKARRVCASEGTEK